ncbi:MAG: HAD-IC family P-type ATPase [Firmicutes bacterium]|nr:HAD-IC family P-type ATPase [Bacillota bacterium]
MEENNQNEENKPQEVKPKRAPRKKTLKAEETIIEDNIPFGIEQEVVLEVEHNDEIKPKRAPRKKMPNAEEIVDTPPLAIEQCVVVDTEKETTIGKMETDKTSLIQETYLKKRKKNKVSVNLDIDKAERFSPTAEYGLNAFQVEMRQVQGYVNQNTKSTGKTYGSIFFTNIFTIVNLITFIVAGALITTIIVADQGVNLAQFAFLLIILLNIGIGIFQEIRAKRKIEKLSLVTAPSAVVIREGIKITVPIAEVVLDDVMHLTLGRQVSADCVVLSGECEVNEAMLTGESEPVKKKQGDILYSGSYLTSGTVHARVDKTGANNYVEKLASHVKRYKKPSSELQNSIRFIMKIITFSIIPISAIMIFLQFRNTYSGDHIGYRLYSVVQSWSGAIIGMLPTGMFLLTSMALAIGVVRLARKNALVQDLYCIEMLARADVLCLDKTGTLTDGSMQVNKVINFIKEEGADAKVAAIIGSMLTATEDNNQTAIAMASYFGYSAQMRAIKTLPFSSSRKFSAVTFDDEQTYCLGAPEFIIKDMGIRLEALVNEYSAKGYRVLCLAQVNGVIYPDGKVPSSRKAIALIIVEDYIREDAIETISWFKDNDVAIKIISGDNPVTVAEVAKRCGVDGAEMYLSLDGMSNQEVIEAADKYTVFGRVSPEQKALLVKSIKSKGHTVAMTGDGVNDILAMREADCSIAIASGADAARNVSHLVLMDSKFSSMPKVVMEGRRVINNITKTSSLFLMKTLMSIVLAVIFMIMQEPYPFRTNHLLFLEMFVIGLPSLALALQPNFERIKGNFLANVTGRAIPGGFAIVISVMAMFVYRAVMTARFVDHYVFGAYPDDLILSMQVMALSLTGIVVLIKICEPFNVFRVFVLLVCYTFMMVGLLALGGIVDVVRFDLDNVFMMMHMFFLIIMILIAYFVISVVMRLLKTFKLME